MLHGIGDANMAGNYGISSVQGIEVGGDLTTLGGGGVTLDRPKIGDGGSDADGSAREFLEGGHCRWGRGWFKGRFSLTWRRGFSGGYSVQGVEGGEAVEQFSGEITEGFSLTCCRGRRAGAG